jgi:hypothetical protein
MYQFFGVSMVQLKGGMKEILGKDEVRGLMEASVDGRTLRVVGLEMQGVVKSLEYLKQVENPEKGKATDKWKGKGKASGKWRDGELGVVVVTVDNVEKPMVDVGIPYEEWKEVNSIMKCCGQPPLTDDANLHLHSLLRII